MRPHPTKKGKVTYMNPAAVLLGAILGALTLAFLVLTYVGYRVTFYCDPHRKIDPYFVSGPQTVPYEKTIHGMVDETAAIPFEEVSIRSRDGLRLVGRYYHKKDGAPLEIEVHGYRSCGLRDFCGGCARALQDGYNVLLIEQRSHGVSGGHIITFGVREREDVADWVAYAARRFGADTPIFLTGISMGAATVLMASELPMEGNVVGIIADCPYSSPEAIVRTVAKRRKLGAMYPFIWLGGGLFGHFLLSDASAVEAVRHTDIPILLIHGDDDRFVPCEMSREIADACASEVKLVLIHGAGHALSFVADNDTYTREVAAFRERALAIADERARAAEEEDE